MIFYPLLAKKTIKVQDLNAMGILIYCVSRVSLASLIALIFVWATAAVAGPNDDLIEAARNGNSAVVRTLLARGADVNAKSKVHGTALIGAAKNGHLEMVTQLLAKGSDINGKDDFGKTALMHASWNGHLEVVKLLLGQNNIDVYAEDNNGNTALLEAADQGHLDVAKALVEKKAQQIARANAGAGPMITSLGITEYWAVADNWCAFGDCKPVVELLVTADVNARDSNGKTVLMYAAWDAHPNMVKLLLAQRADVNAKDNVGRTALMCAAQEGRLETVELLLTKGADTNVRDKDGITALMYATRRDFLFSKEYRFSSAIPSNPKVIKALLAKGAEIDARDNNGQTALMHAVQNGFRNRPLEVVKALLANGADINAKDNNGRTALTLISECNAEVEKELLTKGAEGKHAKILESYEECIIRYATGTKF